MNLSPHCTGLKLLICRCFLAMQNCPRLVDLPAKSCAKQQDGASLESAACFVSWGGGGGGGGGGERLLLRTSGKAGTSRAYMYCQNMAEHGYSKVLGLFDRDEMMKCHRQERERQRGETEGRGGGGGGGIMTT